MGEDPTENLEQKYDTNPTIETILTEMRAGFAQVNARIDGLEQKMDKRFDAVESRLDDMARKVKLLNGDVLQLRSDLERVMEKVEGMETHFKEPA